MIDVQLYNKVSNELIWVELPCEDIENYLNDNWEIYFAESSDCSLDFEYSDTWDLETLQSMAEELKTLEPWSMDVLVAIVNSNVADLETALEQLDNYTLFPRKTLAEVAEKLAEDYYNLPSNLFPYFDFEALGRDLENDGYIQTDYGVLHKY